MTCMTPFQASKCFLALKLHFRSDSYDIFKFKGCVKNWTKESFEKRNDRHKFEKISRTMNDDEIVNLFVANLISKADYSGLYDDQSETCYRKWKGYRQALQYNFKNEITTLFYEAKESNLCYNDVFFNNDQHPLVLVALIGKTISMDTFIILDRINSFIGSINVDFVSEDILRTARKYSAFLKVDTDVYQKIVQQAKEDIFGNTDNE